ncbi:hypothetical protein KCU81_g843, partial [Aureobasidium melanogenum]
LLGGEELVCVARFLCTVGVDRSKTLLDEQLSEALTVDVQLADEAANLVGAFNIDFNVALLASADESELGILTRYQYSESASTLDKVDDSRNLSLARQEGELAFGLVNGSTVVDIFGLLRGLRVPHALSSALCSLLGGKEVVVDRRTVGIIHAVSDDRGVSLLNEHKTDVLVVESNSGHLTLIKSFSSGSLAVDGDFDVLSDQTLAQELLGLGTKCSSLVAQVKDVTFEKTQLVIPGIAFGLSKLGHLGTEPCRVVISATSETGLEKEFSNAAHRVSDFSDQKVVGGRGADTSKQDNCLSVLCGLDQQTTDEAVCAQDTFNNGVNGLTLVCFGEGPRTLLVDLGVTLESLQPLEQLGALWCILLFTSIVSELDQALTYNEVEQMLAALQDDNTVVASLRTKSLDWKAPGSSPSLRILGALTKAKLRDKCVSREHALDLSFHKSHDIVVTVDSEDEEGRTVDELNQLLLWKEIEWQVERGGVGCGQGFEGSRAHQWVGVGLNLAEG